MDLFCSIVNYFTFNYMSLYLHFDYLFLFPCWTLSVLTKSTNLRSERSVFGVVTVPYFMVQTAFSSGREFFKIIEIPVLSNIQTELFSSIANHELTEPIPCEIIRNIANIW